MNIKIQTGLPLFSIIVLMLLGINTLQAQPQTFSYPRLHGLIIDNCKTWGTNCRDGGAQEFCKLKGYEKAINWQIYNPGRTYIIGSGQVCQGSFCGGYSSITCSNGQHSSNSGDIIVTLKDKRPCVYASGPSMNTSHYLCRFKYSLLNTTNRPIHMTSGVGEKQNMLGTGTTREGVGYWHDLNPGQEMNLNFLCLIPHGYSIGRASVKGTGHHRGNSNREQFVWKLIVDCP